MPSKPRGRRRRAALILNTPWNPVGTVLSREELAVIARFCERRNVALISDEIYETITYGGHRHLSPLAVCARPCGSGLS